MIEVGSYCCSLVERPLPSSNTNPVCAGGALCFFGLGIGVMNLALRRFSMIFWVGCPASSSSQCRLGYPYGEFRIGWSKNGFDIEGSRRRHEECGPLLHRAPRGPIPLECTPSALVGQAIGVEGVFQFVLAADDQPGGPCAWIASRGATAR